MAFLGGIPFLDLPEPRETDLDHIPGIQLGPEGQPVLGIREDGEVRPGKRQLQGGPLARGRAWLQPGGAGPGTQPLTRWRKQNQTSLQAPLACAGQEVLTSFPYFLGHKGMGREVLGCSCPTQALPSGHWPWALSTSSRALPSSTCWPGSWADPARSKHCVHLSNLQ